MASTTTYLAATSRRLHGLKNQVVRRLNLLVLLALLAVVTPRAADAQVPAAPIVINEILASNQGGITGIVDEDGDSPDYIELHNPTTEAVSLADHVLVDGGNIWPFPPTAQVEPGGYLLIWASGKNRTVPSLHANFELSRDGEYLAVLDGANEVIAELAPAYPAQQQNVSWGLLPDG